MFKRVSKILKSTDIAEKYQEFNKKIAKMSNGTSSVKKVAKT